MCSLGWGDWGDRGGEKTREQMRGLGDLEEGEGWVIYQGKAKRAFISVSYDPAMLLHIYLKLGNWRVLHGVQS
jgi:hypothetical protein